MKVGTLFLLIVLTAIDAFAALNWSAFMAPTILSFGVTTVEAPLGLIMFGLLAFLTALFHRRMSRTGNGSASSCEGGA